MVTLVTFRNLLLYLKGIVNLFVWERHCMSFLLGCNFQITFTHPISTHILYIWFWKLLCVFFLSACILDRQINESSAFRTGWKVIALLSSDGRGTTWTMLETTPRALVSFGGDLAPYGRPRKKKKKLYIKSDLIFSFWPPGGRVYLVSGTLKWPFGALKGPKMQN